MTRCTKPSKTGMGYVLKHMPLHLLIPLLRVLADLQGSCNRIRCHGFHRLLCEVDPHPHVSIFVNHCPRMRLISSPSQK